MLPDPLLPVLIAVMSGILLSRTATFPAVETAAAAVAFALLAFFAHTRSRALFLACAWLACCAGGILLERAHRPGPPPRIDAGMQESVLLDGCVVEPPIFYEGRDQFTLELGRHANARVTVAVRENEQPPALNYGQRVEIEARVRPIRNFQNPGAFDFAAYSARRNTFWTASVRAGSPIRVLPGRCGSRFWASISALRTAALNRIEALYPGDPYATGMMDAILIGETSKLEKIWTDHFRRTGTFHALVISGLHVSVLAGVFLFLLRLCLLPEVPALVMTACAAWTYALVAGCAAPVVRAASGFTLYLVGRFFYRKGRVMNLLACIALVYLAYDPGQLFEASFQLSFLAVAAIGAIAVPIMEKTSGPYARAASDLDASNRDAHLTPLQAQFRVELRLLAETLHSLMRIPQTWLLHSLAFLIRAAAFAYDMVVISTVIQIGLALPMAIYFHRISLSGLSANVIIVPLLTLVVPIGFLAIFTGWHLPAAFAELLLRWAEATANWHALREPNWRVPDPPLWLDLAFVAALLAVAFALRARRLYRWPALVALLTLFALIFWHPFPPDTQRNSLELSVIDVGQGDSLLVAFPDGKLMLIDGGGIASYGRKIKSRFDIGEDVVSPYLWSRSIGKLDVVVATHAHEDHTGGLGAVILNFRPNQLWTGANTDEPVWLGIKAKAQSVNASIVPMLAGRKFAFGGTDVEVLSPPADYTPARTPKNDDSLVLRITYGQRKFLLTGDMEKPMESRLVFNGEAARADVLKVGHHGSHTSSSDLFLDAVHPTYALISDGAGNLFHHPSPDVLARLADHHANILRTDIDGLITVRTDGYRLSVETFRADALAHTTPGILPYSY